MLVTPRSALTTLGTCALLVGVALVPRAHADVWEVRARCPGSSWDIFVDLNDANQASVLVDPNDGLLLCDGQLYALIEIVEPPVGAVIDAFTTTDPQTLCQVARVPDGPLRALTLACSSENGTHDELQLRVSRQEKVQRKKARRRNKKKARRRRR